MSRAADSLVNPRRNLLLLIPNKSAYDYKKNFIETTSLTFDYGTIEAGYMLEDFGGKVATRDRVTGAITFNTDAAGGYGVTLTPRAKPISGVQKQINGNFDNGISGWGTSVGCSLSFNPLKYAQCLRTGTDGNLTINQICQTAGKFYKISFIAKSNTYTGKAGITNAFYSNPVNEINPNMSNSWQKYECYGVALFTTALIYLSISNVVNGTQIDVDEIVIQELNLNKYRDFIFQGSENLENITLSPPFAFVKYPFPGDFSAMSGLGASYNATHRRLRMYELSCLQWSEQYAKIIQPYLYAACQAENLPYSIDHLQTEAVQLTDTGMDDNLLMWHSAVFRRDLQTVSLQKLITKNYDVLQNYDLEAISNKPAEGGNISPVEIPCFETLGGEVKNISSAGEVYLSNSEKWMICFVANWYGLQSFSPYQIFIPFGEDAPGNTCGFAVNQLNNSFDFTGVDETGVSFGVSPYEYVGRTTVYHLYADGAGHLSLYINGILASTKTVNTGIKLKNLYTNELAFAFAGRIYERRVNVGSDVNTYSVLTDYNNLRAYYPEYENVLIGSQNWTTSNAQITMTPLGTVIPEVTSAAAWAALTTPGWCYYNNSKVTGQTYGKLYNWYAVKQIYDDIIAFNASVPASRKYLYAPANTSQIATLQTFLGGYTVAGGKVKITGLIYWNSPNTGATNETKFSMLGTGYRDQLATFNNQKVYGAFWCYNENTATTGNVTELSASLNSLTINNFLGSQKTRGFCLRLIKIF